MTSPADAFMTVATFAAAARDGFALPQPGCGRTADRFDSLRAHARRDGSLGRLVESHVDALAIFSEAGRCPPARAALAVWASESACNLVLRREGQGFRLKGTKRFCGGAPIVDAALVTARAQDDDPSEPVIILVDLRQPGVVIDGSAWAAPAFTEAGICSVHFDVRLDASCVVGPPRFYTDRPGFWQGAVGIGAVWAGMGDALIDDAKFRSNDTLASVARGEIAALRWGIDAALAHAAATIDASPMATGHHLAIAARHVVGTNLTDILRLLDHETGPAPIAFDARWQQRRLELTMSLLQSHGRRDLAAISGSFSV